MHTHTHTHSTWNPSKSINIDITTFVNCAVKHVAQAVCKFIIYFILCEMCSCKCVMYVMPMPWTFYHVPYSISLFEIERYKQNRYCLRVHVTSRWICNKKRRFDEKVQWKWRNTKWKLNPWNMEHETYIVRRIRDYCLKIDTLSHFYASILHFVIRKMLMFNCIWTKKSGELASECNGVWRFAFWCNLIFTWNMQSDHNLIQNWFWNRNS